MPSRRSTTTPVGSCAKFIIKASTPAVGLNAANAVTRESAPAAGLPRPLAVRLLQNHRAVRAAADVPALTCLDQLKIEDLYHRLHQEAQPLRSASLGWRWGIWAATKGASAMACRVAHPPAWLAQFAKIGSSGPAPSSPLTVWPSGRDEHMLLERSGARPALQTLAAHSP